MINLKREIVKDYHKSLYEDLKGKIPVQDLIILEVWNALFWIDNKVYHLIGSVEAMIKVWKPIEQFYYHTILLFLH